MLKLLKQLFHKALPRVDWAKKNTMTICHGCGKTMHRSQMGMRQVDRHYENSWITYGGWIYTCFRCVAGMAGMRIPADQEINKEQQDAIIKAFHKRWGIKKPNKKK